MAESKISDIIATSLSEIKNLIDANTIIGEPINTPSGTVIIPVSKITMGLATGGVDFAAKNSADVKKDDKFSGGGGTGVSVTPVAFLVVKGESVRVVNVNQPATIDAIERAVDLAPELIDKCVALFKKKDKEEE